MVGDHQSECQFYSTHPGGEAFHPSVKGESEKEREGGREGESSSFVSSAISTRITHSYWGTLA